MTRLHVKSGSGDTVITETDGNAIRVVETLQWRDSKPDAQHSVDGDTLFIRYDCAQSWGNCSVNYKIEIPKGLQVDADAGSGDITLRSLTGPLNLSAGSGDVDASGLAGKKVVAEAGSGNIELKYTTAPDSAELEAGSGDVTLHVPAAPTTSRPTSAPATRTWRSTRTRTRRARLRLDRGSGRRQRARRDNQVITSGMSCHHRGRHRGVQTLPIRDDTNARILRARRVRDRRHGPRGAPGAAPRGGPLHRTPGCLRGRIPPAAARAGRPGRRLDLGHRRPTPRTRSRSCSSWPRPPAPRCSKGSSSAASSRTPPPTSAPARRWSCATWSRRPAPTP